jgi:TusA-related sulfurtransferase
MKQIDLRNTIIPFSFLKVSNAFKELDPGETLEILWSHSEPVEDLIKILPNATVEWQIKVKVEEFGGQNAGVRIYLTKKTKEEDDV